MIEALDIRVRGIVQGVGFRPFVYRLAHRYLINGWVLNDNDGVFVHAEGETKLLDEFVMAIADDAPAAATVKSVELTEVPLKDCTTFEIRESVNEDTDDLTRIAADLGICEDCAAELADPQNRRYRYPFINCTNCGPRFTIIDGLPYDRKQTSMASFTMCEQCQEEFDDPANRRFHAQPNACFTCGPELSWVPVTDGVADQSRTITAKDQATSDEALAKAIAILSSGGIVAAKGLGGFHLVCDGENPEAIARLRERKHRDAKPFAVMVASVEDARRWCEVSKAEAALLESAARPIVLLRKKKGAGLASGLADGLKELGVMLPTTPLQCLLAADAKAAFGSRMLVMTSGNLSGEPIVIDDEEAKEKLAVVADGILGHNRDILARFDDSVCRVLDLGGTEAIQFLRRARGYAPLAVAITYGDEALKEQAPDSPSHKRPEVFAAGSEQKNTFTFTNDSEAFVSPYIGDMADGDVFDAWLATKKRMERLFALKPAVLACDSHPDYEASRWARKEAALTSLPLTEVQHHQAHIASVLGEHGRFGPCLGIAFDGTGFGPDGALWGGEALIENVVDYERFANLTYMPMAGGAAAIKHPNRMAFGMLWTYDLLDHPGAASLKESLGDLAGLCQSMIEEGVNCPFTSSMGRFFDGVSAILGVCEHSSYEGEAAILLDGIRADEDNSSEEAEIAQERYSFTFQKNAATAESTAHDTSVLLVDGSLVLKAILDDKVAGVSVPVISLRFHRAVVNLIATLAEFGRTGYELNLVALSGGCFMNRFLVEKACALLEERGFTVALNSSLPPNDGCVSYGQAVVAAASR